MIILNRDLNQVSVDGVVRDIDLSEINADIAVINYNPLTQSGMIINQDNSLSSLGAYSFAPFEKYVLKWRAAGTPPTRTLEQVKTDKREQINSMRDNLEQSGFPYMDKVIDSNPVSVQRITVAVQAAQAAIGAGQPFAITWTCQDNSTLELDAVGMMGMPVALAMFANILHETARAKKELIDVATTIEEVEAVTWE